MLKVAMLSKWHVHASGYANELKKTGKVEIVGVWDDDEKRGKPWAEEVGCPFYKSLDDVLAIPGLDAVICDAPTTQHKDVIIKAAKAGKHIFTEKALAPTVKECEEIKKAIADAGVTFCISYPHKGMPVNKFVKKHIEEGTFGKVTLIRIRNAHNGVSGKWLPAYWFEKKDAAGGAMMDLGCHGMYLLADFLGKPTRVTGMFNAPCGTQVDENAVSVMEFEGGAMGICETGFISYASPYAVEVYGTDGSFVFSDGKMTFRAKKFEGFDVTPNLPAPSANPIEQFVDACINGTGSPEGMGIEEAIDLTRLLEYSYISDEESKICKL